MDSTKNIVLIAGLVVLLLGGAVGGWMVSTAPPDNLEPWKEKQCNDYVSELEMLNRYKIFWSFIQRRVAFNDCLDRIEQSGGKPPAGSTNQ